MSNLLGIEIRWYGECIICACGETISFHVQKAQFSYLEKYHTMTVTFQLLLTDHRYLVILALMPYVPCVEIFILCLVVMCQHNFFKLTFIHIFDNFIQVFKPIMNYALIFFTIITF